MAAKQTELVHYCTEPVAKPYKGMRITNGDRVVREYDGKEWVIEPHFKHVEIDVLWCRFGFNGEMYFDE